jgi:O-antigen ligase
MRLEDGLFKNLSYEAKALLFFYIIIFIPGLLTSTNVSFYLDNIKNGIEYTLFFISVYYVVIINKSMDFPLKVLGIVIFAVAYTAYFNGTYVGGRLIISEVGNPNTLALLMYLGIILCLYFWKKGLVYKILIIAYIPLALTNIALSGSRKSFIGTAIFIFLFIISSLLPLIKKQNIFRILIILIILVIVAIVLYNWFAPLYQNSILFNRLNNLTESDKSTTVRLQMYKEAFILFKEYPLFGVGYDNFRYYSVFKTYSHSTYSEVLVSSGIIGALIYFSIYISTMYKLIKLYVRRFKNNLSVYIEALLLSYMITGLVIATVKIDLYDIKSYLFLACISGYYELNKKYLWNN